MTERPPASVSGLFTLFDDIRNQLRLAVTLTYVAYTGIHAVQTKIPFQEALSEPRYQITAACLVIAVLSVARLIHGFRSNLVIQIVGLAMLIYGAFTLPSATLTEQMSYFVWTTVSLPLLFMQTGTGYGILSVAVLLGTVVNVATRHPPSTPETQQLWLSGLMAMLAFSLVGYLTMRFIERNLSLHEQTSGQLRAAQLDALTGILGRAALEAELQRAIDQALENRSALSVIVTDIDHFKQVNDLHGHGAGDDVLRAFAKRLRRNVGTSGSVGRWGGEEFLIVLPGMSREDATALAERLRREVSQSDIAGLPITASFGVASLRPPHDGLEQLFGRADERLYEAKNSGRNMVR
ncbi:MAG: GGDEF domain-containing protein [Deinococcus sp.]|uniref:GGDEF domain-containing protein n=1 Tax=Deinococcus sp. TaxID=47478 RepID=UPI0026DC1AFD|nr:GGDEF domain-containing protein [Deinococcus sp.]MDO4245384.1 GGDEF domain-containing protein [Deinococcus sp.]